MHNSLNHLTFDWHNGVAQMTSKAREAYFAAQILFHEAGIYARKDPRTQQWVFVKRDPLPQTRPEMPELKPLSNPEGLREYQIEPVMATVASLKRYGGHLNASDMGVGKTYMSLASFRELGIEPVVVAPATLLESWRRAATHLGMTCRTVSYEKLNRNTEFGSWVGEKKFLRYRWHPSILGIIFDEAHRCKGTGTKAQKALVGAVRSGAMVDALTATGASDPLEMKALGVLLGIHDGRDFYDWAKLHGCVPGFHGGFKFSEWPGIMERIHGQIFPAKGCRVRKEDLGDAIPPTQFILETCQLPETTKKAIGALYQDVYEAVEELYSRVEDWKAPDSALGKVNLMFQEIELRKVPAFVEHIKNCVEEGYSVPVFVRFNATISLISKALKGIPHGFYQGVKYSSDRDTRQYWLDEFQANRIRILLTNYAAGATGLSLHDLHGGHPRASIHSMHYDSRLMKQAFGRTQRDGGKTKSIQKIIGAAGTIEDEILDRVANKLHNMDLLNDGDLLPSSFSAHLLELKQRRQTFQSPCAVA